MEQGSTQTRASFTGTLLKREKTGDNRMVQLVFREGDKNWLCVSTNLSDATLPIGGTYKIQGVFKHMGERPYVYQPTIVSVKPKRKKLTFTRVLVASVGIALVGMSVGAYALLKPSHEGQALGASTNQPSQTVVVKDTTDSPAQPATDTPTSTDQPPVTATPTSQKKTSTTPANNSVTPPPVTTTPVAVDPPALDCDPVSPKAFGEEYQAAYGDFLPGDVIREGVVGEQQTCYPDGRSASGVTTETKAPVNKIIAE